jgi:hypothetical protein
VARYSLIKVGDIFFTNDGTETGIPCRISVKGLDDSALNVGFQNITSANGTVWTQVVDVGQKSIIYSFTFDFINVVVHNQIIDLMNTLLSDQELAVLQITGSTGDRTHNVKPSQSPVQGLATFSGDILKNVTYSFITS